MAIRPVELQGVVQRSQDMSQIKQNQDIKPQTDQSNIQIQIHHEVKQNSQQVTKFENSEKKENRYDAKEKGNGSYFNNQKKKQKKKEEEEEEGSVKVKATVSNFDMKI